jgi:Tfp pilus assembly protein PilF
VLWQASLAMRTKLELERAVQLDPNNLDAREGLLEYYLRAPAFMGGSDEGARRQATEIRKRDSIAGHEALARIYTHQKKASLALNEYVAALREQPNAAKTHYDLGVFYLGEKNYQVALEQMDDALKIDPNFMPAVFQIGHIAVLSSNNLPGGEKALRRYLSYKPRPDDPPLGRAYYWLGVIYEKWGRKTEARQNYFAARKLIPHADDVAEALRRVS